MSIIRNVKKLA